MDESARSRRCHVCTRVGSPASLLAMETRRRGIACLHATDAGTTHRFAVAEPADHLGNPSLSSGRALAEFVTRHGVLLDVLGMGVLITGESGVGKSELALELITRGNGLVADDVVEISRIAPDTLEGRCPECCKDFLEVRGLGMLNIRTIFGETAVRPRKNLKLIVHSRSRQAALSRTRAPAADASTEEILGVRVRKVMIPVAAGRNLAVLVEAAVRNYVLQLRGIDSTQEFIRRQEQHFGREPEATDDAASQHAASTPSHAARPGHRPVRLGQEHRAEGAGGQRLLLRRQPAGESAAWPGRLPWRRRATRSVAVSVDVRSGPTCVNCRDNRRPARSRHRPARAVPRRQDRHAGQALLRDAPPPSAFGRQSHPAGMHRGRTRAAARNRRAGPSHRHQRPDRHMRCAPGSKTSSAYGRVRA